MSASILPQLSPEDAGRALARLGEVRFRSAGVNLFELELRSGPRMLAQTLARDPVDGLPRLYAAWVSSHGYQRTDRAAPCGCGHVYSREAFVALELVTRNGTTETRHCSHCRGTVSAEAP